MKISMRWLNDYVDVSDFFAQPQKLADILTAGGLEVEAIDNQKLKFDKVVVGHLLQVGQHPNADRLTLCEVNVGDGVVQKIVCGATNHKKDDKVAVALPGAVLPGDFKIKLSKIRGVESQGMLCSETELGLASESAGIMILPADARIGQPFAEHMGSDDVIFEVNITPNRADCLSHFGLAREVAALLGRRFEFPVHSFSESGSTKELIDLQVLDPAACPRYSGRAVLGVKIGPSPEWMSRRLKAVGVNSINNVVDITNYVMLELGQPLHAFDLRYLQGGQVVVKNAERGEKFTTFDGTTLTLTGSELTIRDAKNVVALAGIVGGPHSGIQPDTQDVFIECAYFQPAKIRRTSRQLGIATDASYRFSRGIDPEGIMLALNRTCQLLQDLAGGRVQGECHDFYPQREQPPVISLYVQNVHERLGFHVSVSDLKACLERLGCEVMSEHDGHLQIVPPAYRRDMTVDMDIIEDVARLQGYDKIPETLPELNHWPSPHHPQFIFHNKVRRHLAAQGHLEAVHYAFEPSTWQNRCVDLAVLRSLGLYGDGVAVPVRNPLNEDANMMRVLLADGLLKNAELNQHRGNFHGRLFEIGAVYAKEADGYREDWHLGLVAWGRSVGWLENAQPGPLVYDLRTLVENLFQHLQSRSWRLQAASDKLPLPAFLHPGQSAAVFYEGKWIGFIGTLHPAWREDLKLRESVVVGELNLDRLMQGQPRVLTTHSISKFPPVDRDFAFVIPKTLPATDVIAEMRKAAGEVLRDIDVFDVFEGDKVGPDHRSVAFRLRFQDFGNTLSEVQINELHTKIVNSLSQKFSISMR